MAGTTSHMIDLRSCFVCETVCGSFHISGSYNQQRLLPETQRDVIDFTFAYTSKFYFGLIANKQFLTNITDGPTYLTYFGNTTHRIMLDVFH